MPAFNEPKRSFPNHPNNAGFQFYEKLLFQKWLDKIDFLALAICFKCEASGVENIVRRHSIPPNEVDYKRISKIVGFTSDKLKPVMLPSVAVELFDEEIVSYLKEARQEIDGYNSEYPGRCWDPLPVLRDAITESRKLLKEAVRELDYSKIKLDHQGYLERIRERH